VLLSTRRTSKVEFVRSFRVKWPSLFTGGCNKSHFRQVALTFGCRLRQEEIVWKLKFEVKKNYSMC
jgi:hypothetical protein